MMKASAGASVERSLILDAALSKEVDWIRNDQGTLYAFASLTSYVQGAPESSALEEGDLREWLSWLDGQE